MNAAQSQSAFAASQQVALLNPRTPWLSPIYSSAEARARLFCFPYAGGDALTIYRKWPTSLPTAIEMCPVQIPGRGRRVTEAPYDNLTSIVKALGEALLPYFNKPFAFFGHSMGAMMAFELSRWLRREHGKEPGHLFVSGRTAPQVPDRDQPTYDLPESEFLERIKLINGTPKEVLQHVELMKLMLPVLKADFRLCQTHTYVDAPPLNCPITVFGGLSDAASREDLEAWRKQTVNRFNLHVLPGDHFFIKTEERTLLHIVSNHLLTLSA
jgi:medium-chain acyl-[acyl-carrier-protein] hydrolase